MKEIFAKHHVARLLVYSSLCALGIVAIYGSFFISKTYHLAQQNKERIDHVEVRILQREQVASTYIPMILAIRSLVDSHQNVLNKIMERQAAINKLLEKPLEHRSGYWEKH